MKDVSVKDLEVNLPLISRKAFEREIIIGSFTYTKNRLMIIAGPCTVESRPQIMKIAAGVKKAGANMLRAGVFKPLTFPYGDPLNRCDADSDGVDIGRNVLLSEADMFKRAEERFKYLREAGDKFDLPIVSEITYSAAMGMMEKYVDMFQIGYRHMFNMDLISALSRTEKPVLIKRHYGESLRSLLGVGEHFEARNKHNIMFCERGITAPHTHNTESRAIVDIQAIPALKEYAPTVPVIVDPSHATFKRGYVASISRAAIAAGADGLLIEVHNDPEKAWVDPLQALSIEAFGGLMEDISGIAGVMGKVV